MCISALKGVQSTGFYVVAEAYRESAFKEDTAVVGLLLLDVQDLLVLASLALLVVAFFTYVAFIGKREEEAESRRRETYEHLELLAESVRDYAIFMLDPAGAVTTWNEGAHRIMGYGAEEVVGQHLSVFYTESDIRNRRPTLSLRMAETEGVYEEEGLRVREDGTCFWASVHITALRHDDGELRGFSEVVRDISERKEAERNLRQSEERFRLLVQNSSDILSVVDRDGIIRYASPAFERIRGYSPDAVVGTSIFDYLFPGDVEEAHRHFRRITSQPGIHPPFEVRVSDGTGAPLYLEVAANNLLDDLNLKGIVVNQRDVSERKHAEERLQESEAKYRTLVEKIPVTTYIEAPDAGEPVHDILYVSPQIESLLGYSQEEWASIPELWMNTLHPEDRDRVLAEKASTEKTGETFNVQYRSFARDRSLVWIHDEAVLVRDEAGNPLYWQGVMYDLTEKMEAAEQLLQSEERYRAVVEQAPVGIYLLDSEDMRILEANPAFEHMLGYADQEIVGKEVYELVALSKDEIDTALQRTLREGKRFVGERHYRCKDSSLIIVEVSTSTIFYAGKNVICVIVSDITQRKQMEHALQQAKEAERQQIARDLHDDVLQDLFDTLYLAQITQLKLRDKKSEWLAEVDEQVLGLRKAEKGLRAVINNLRQGDIQEQSFLNILTSVVETTRQKIPGTKIDLRVRGAASLEFPENTKIELLRIIQEAFTNARRHSGARHIRIDVLVRDNIIIEVTDDGCGFDPDTTSGRVGLAAMRERASHLQAHLNIESAPGSGTKVTILLPIHSGTVVNEPSAEISWSN